MPISHSPLFSPPSAGMRTSPLASRHTGLLPTVPQPDVIILICLVVPCQLHTKTQEIIKPTTCQSNQQFSRLENLFIHSVVLTNEQVAKTFMLILEGFQLYGFLLSEKIKLLRVSWLSSCYWHENSRYISTRRNSTQYWLSSAGTKCVCGSLVDITWADTLHVLRSEHKTGHYSIKLWGFSTPAFSAKSEARFWKVPLNGVSLVLTVWLKFKAIQKTCLIQTGSFSLNMNSKTNPCCAF